MAVASATGLASEIDASSGPAGVLLGGSFDAVSAALPSFCAAYEARSDFVRRHQHAWCDARVRPTFCLPEVLHLESQTIARVSSPTPETPGRLANVCCACLPALPCSHRRVKRIQTLSMTCLQSHHQVDSNFVL